MTDEVTPPEVSTLMREFHDEATAMLLVYSAGRNALNDTLALPAAKSLFDTGVDVGIAAALSVMRRRYELEPRHQAGDV